MITARGVRVGSPHVSKGSTLQRRPRQLAAAFVIGTGNLGRTPPKNDDKTSPKTRNNKEKKDDKDKTQAYLYAFIDGVLKPIALKTGVFSALLGAQTNIVHDKALNKAVYGVNGDEILSGNVDISKQLPPETLTFRETVSSLFPTQK